MVRHADAARKLISNHDGAPTRPRVYLKLCIVPSDEPVVPELFTVHHSTTQQCTMSPYFNAIDWLKERRNNQFSGNSQLARKFNSPARTCAMNVRKGGFPFSAKCRAIDF